MKLTERTSVLRQLDWQKTSLILVWKYYTFSTEIKTLVVTNSNAADEHIKQ